MLISVSELLGRSWRFTTARWKSLWPYAAWLFLPNVVLAACGFLALLVSGYSEAINIIVLVFLGILVVLNAFLGVWVSLSLTYATGHGLSSGVVPEWHESFTNTSRLIIPTVLASIVVSIIFLAGIVAFFVPGIIFMGWYLFVVYEIVFDNERGMAALRASKALVVGRWWQTIFRFFVPVVAYGVIAFAVEAVLYIIIPMPSVLMYRQLLINFIQGLVTSITAPFAMASTLSLYISLKQTPTLSSAPPTTETKPA